MNRMMDKHQLTYLLQLLSDSFNEKQDELCQLDAELGDGDLGLTMNKAMYEALLYIRDTEEKDLGIIASNIGLQISEVAASTIGTLIASGFRKAGSYLKGKHEITTDELVEAFAKFNEGIQKRGKAEIGDKTILDVLIPVQQYMKNTEPSEWQNTPNKLVVQAEQHLTIATQLQSQKGRAARYLEKTIGKADAGTKAAVYGLNALSKFLDHLNEEAES